MRKIIVERWIKTVRKLSINCNDTMCYGCPEHKNFRCLVFDEPLEEVEGFCIRCKSCLEAEEPSCKK
jgi:hypothetical protein